MDTTWTQGILAEALDAATHLLDPIEGLEDDLRLNIKDETRGVVQGRLDELTHRKGLIKTVMQDARQLITDIEALLADGYPTIPVMVVSPAVWTDLDDQRRTRIAADALFAPPDKTTNVDSEISPERPTH